MIRNQVYALHDLVDYINWIYFFHAWNIPPRFVGVAEVHDCMSCRQTWINRFSGTERDLAVEADKLYRDALSVLRQLDAGYQVKSRFGLFPAWSEGDDIWVATSSTGCFQHSSVGFDQTEEVLRLPFLRQQQVRHSEQPHMCLSDFVAPWNFYYGKRPDAHRVEQVPFPRGTRLGVFVSAVDECMECLYAKDSYLHMLVQTLCDRLAEAATEKMHEEVRRNYWGYAPYEQLTPRELFAEKYEGKRPAVGYPSIPDQSMNFLIDELIDMEQIGVRLTSNGMMQPHAAVSGFMFDHPACAHFSVGAIGDDQLEDYARRRNLSTECCRKYLSGNVRHV